MSASLLQDYGKGARFNYVRGEKWEAAKNGLSPPELFFWPQADPCLCGWRQINWLITYPGKLDVAPSYLRAPHIYISRASLCTSEIIGQLLWLTGMRRPLRNSWFIWTFFQYHLNILSKLCFSPHVSWLIYFSLFLSPCAVFLNFKTVKITHPRSNISCSEFPDRHMLLLLVTVSVSQNCFIKVLLNILNLIWKASVPRI